MTFRSDLQGTLKSFLELGSSATEPVLVLAKSPNQIDSFQLTLPPSSGETGKFLLATSPGILNFSFLLPGDIPNLDANKITSGTLPINRGGTGQATVTGAINALLPSQLGNENKALLTNGTNVFWGTVATSGSTPGGNNSNIQFNDSGDLGGSDNFIWDNITNTFQIKQAASQSSNLVEILDDSDNLLASIDRDGKFNTYQINFKASAIQSLNASSTILPNGTAIAISSTADITLTSTPSIVAGIEGQLISLFNAGNYKITLQDEAQLANSGLKLFGKTIPIPAVTHLLLEYRANKWRQLSCGSIITNLAGYAISITDAPSDGYALLYDSSLAMYIPGEVTSNALLSKFSEANGELYWDGQKVLLDTSNNIGLPDEANVVAYFDSSDSSKFTIDTSGGTNTISRWEDSKNGYELFQGTKTDQPEIITNLQNGLNSLSLYNDFLESLAGTILNSTNFPDNVGTLTVAFKLAQISVDVNYYSIAKCGPSNDSWWNFGGNGYQGIFRNTRLELYPSPAYNSTNPVIISVRSGVSQYEVRVNGVGRGIQSPNWNIGSIFGLGRGWNASFVGYLYGCILRKSDDTTQLTATEQYLNNKWGLGVL